MHQASSIKHQIVINFHFISFVKIIIFAYIFAFFISCNKDDQFIEQREYDDSQPLIMAVHSNPNSNINSESLPFQSTKSPSSELLEFVINQIYSDSLFQLDFYSMIYHYGIPRVNWATIDINSETNYVISIPLMKK